MTEEFIEVVITKPIHGTYISIDKRKLDEAASSGRNMKVSILGVGSAVVSPHDWWNTAIKKEKRIVNYKDKPMTFVYNYLQIVDNFKRNKDVAIGQGSLFKEL